MRVAIADADGNIEARREFPTPGGAPEDAIAKIGRTIDDLARGVWVGARVDAIGIALPGMVHPEAGLVASVANIPGWTDVPLAKLLAGERRIPVAMENDANAAAVGEGWLGAARGTRHHVFIAWGTGIGAGIVVDGRLHRGAHSLAGEIAFFPITQDQVRTEGWDQNVEGLTAGRALAAKAEEFFGEGAKVSDLFDAARSGHADASTFVREVQERVAMATAVRDRDARPGRGGVWRRGRRSAGRLAARSHHRACAPQDAGPDQDRDLGAGRGRADTWRREARAREGGRRERLVLTVTALR